MHEILEVANNIYKFHELSSLACSARMSIIMAEYSHKLIDDSFIHSAHYPLELKGYRFKISLIYRIEKVYDKSKRCRLTLPSCRKS